MNQIIFPRCVKYDNTVVNKKEDKKVNLKKKTKSKEKDNELNNSNNYNNKDLDSFTFNPSAINPAVLIHLANSPNIWTYHYTS